MPFLKILKDFLGRYFGGLAGPDDLGLSRYTWEGLGLDELDIEAELDSQDARLIAEWEKTAPESKKEETPPDAV